jgi:hypothetical protein
MNPKLFPKAARMEEFAPYDKFYLGRWSRDYNIIFLSLMNLRFRIHISYFIIFGNCHIFLVQNIATIL